MEYERKEEKSSCCEQNDKISLGVMIKNGEKEVYELNSVRRNISFVAMRDSIL
jgi:hypothetical protein